MDLNNMVSIVVHHFPYVLLLIGSMFAIVDILRATCLVRLTDRDFALLNATKHFEHTRSYLQRGGIEATIVSISFICVLIYCMYYDFHMLAIPILVSAGGPMLYFMFKLRLRTIFVLSKNKEIEAKESD